MKKSFALLLFFALLLSLLTGCAPSGKKNEKLQILTTVFPLYDWMRNVVGASDTAEVLLLHENGADLHSFQPSVSDLVRVSSSDLFVYVGGPSDDWVENALKNSINPSQKSLNVLTVLGDLVKNEETVEGMQSEEEEDEEPDEHVWLSLSVAAAVVNAFCSEVCALDEAHAQTYRENAQSYLEKLNVLDAEYRAAVAAAPRHTLLFADRFPFRYLTDDYGLSYYAAFAGCSAESEASFETVKFLAEKIRELDLKTVLILEGSDGKIAKTVVDASQRDVRTLTVNSIQSVSSREIEAGADYLSMMRDNLAVLTAALQ